MATLSSLIFVALNDIDSTTRIKEYEDSQTKNCSSKLYSHLPKCRACMKKNGELCRFKNFRRYFRLNGLSSGPIFYFGNPLVFNLPKLDYFAFIIKSRWINYLHVEAIYRPELFKCDYCSFPVFIYRLCKVCGIICCQFCQKTCHSSNIVCSMIDNNYLQRLIYESLEIQTEVCPRNDILVMHTDIVFPKLLNLMENKRVTLIDCKTGLKIKSFLESVAMNKRVLKYQDYFDGYNDYLPKLPLQNLLDFSLVKFDPYVEFGSECDSDSCTNPLTLLKTDQLCVMIQGEGEVEWDIWEYHSLKQAIQEITPLDPFKDPSWFLDDYWKHQLPKAKRIEQRVGDIVYLPAGSAFQTVNKCLAVLVKLDFCSIANLCKCMDIQDQYPGNVNFDALLFNYLNSNK
ncbi:hypothetical protein HDV04_000229 [Boothiomyces sp. JEL0838]|nr:hypothetical protein HDV04_000229 [Boothiomyces sp. JEL0838]